MADSQTLWTPTDLPKLWTFFCTLRTLRTAHAGLTFHLLTLHFPYLSPLPDKTASSCLPLRLPASTSHSFGRFIHQRLDQRFRPLFVQPLTSLPATTVWMLLICLDYTKAISLRHSFYSYLTACVCVWVSLALCVCVWQCACIRE